MKKLLVMAVFLLCGGVWLRAQGDLNEQQKVFFRNEKSLGLLLNSDGLGLSYSELISSIKASSSLISGR